MANGPDDPAHPHPNHNRILGWTVRELDDKFESLDQFLDERDRRYEERFKSMDERDKRYDERFIALKDTIRLALDASEKLAAASLSASNEAVRKAETAQHGVNERQNEFRGQLSDQAGTFMPRKETEASMMDIRERVERAARERAQQIEAVKGDMRISVDALRADIIKLRESTSEGMGRRVQQEHGMAANQWTITAVIGAAALVFGLLSSGLISKPTAPPAPPVVIVQPSPAAPAPAAGGSTTDSKSTTKVQP